MNHYWLITSNILTATYNMPNIVLKIQGTLWTDAYFGGKDVGENDKRRRRLLMTDNLLVVLCE